MSPPCRVLLDLDADIIARTNWKFNSITHIFGTLPAALEFRRWGRLYKDHGLKLSLQGELIIARRAKKPGKSARGLAVFDSL